MREKSEKYWAEHDAQEQKRQEADEKLLATDPQAYYAKFPDRHPDVVLEQERREARNAARRARYNPRPRYRNWDGGKEDQGYTAHKAGRSAADNINLEPFLGGQVPSDPRTLKGGSHRKGGR